MHSHRATTDHDDESHPQRRRDSVAVIDDAQLVVDRSVLARFTQLYFGRCGARRP
jgi:hypothetical protein